MDGGILWDHMGSPHFSAVLRNALEALREGRARSRSGSPLEAARDFERVFVAGSRAGALGTLLPDGPFAGEAGGLALLREEGLPGMVVDMGQTSIKVSHGGRRGVILRDFDRLPARGGEAWTPEDRERLRDFLARALREGAGAIPPPAVVLALPCELDSEGLPGGSSYAGMEGDRTLVRDAFVRAGLGHSRVLLINDAELAAASARLAMPRVKTLVLTLGYGVGGAVLLPEK